MQFTVAQLAVITAVKTASGAADLLLYCYIYALCCVFH